MTLSKFARHFITLFAFFLGLSATATAEPKGATPESRAARTDIEKTLGFVPGFLNVIADSALPGVWEEFKGLQLNPKSALSGRTKELIGLAVASQVPCQYCIYAHTEFAELNGASPAEIAETVAIAGAERHWSALLYGLQYDEDKYRSDILRLVKGAKGPARSVTPIHVVDGRTALLDIEQRLGFVPAFLSDVPRTALPGAWREMRDFKMNPKTALPAKDKYLISLAVASQVPSEACVLADTEFAKLAGASETEIEEAVGMAAITRNMSTLLNGHQVDMRAFKSDVDRIVSNVKAAQRSAAAPKAPKQVLSAAR
jgi:AhpD family alkylhydroperoxidase